MTLTLEDRYKYVLKAAYMYFQATELSEVTEDGTRGAPRLHRFSPNLSDAWKFDTYADAREKQTEVRGTTIMRYDVLTMEAIPVAELLRGGGIERRWTEAVQDG